MDKQVSKLKNKRPFIVTIAGLDPSNGAGLTADVKTFEQLKTYGMSVCTAITVQNDIELTECLWTKVGVMKAQLKLLFERFKIDFVKIGVIENWTVLHELLDEILIYNSKVKIIFDPILSSSSDFDFHNTNEDELQAILKKVYLITPNRNEIGQLFQNKTQEETIAAIKKETNLFLKGGHRETEVGKDELFTKEGKYFVLNAKDKNCTEKHGSGCVLSSAITSYLALGFPLLKACYRGKQYTERVLSSNKTLLGYHK